MPAGPFGSTQGPIYPLGKFTIAAAGTTQQLNANVKVTDATGTLSTGVPGTSTQGSPTPMKCANLKINTPISNTGNIYLLFKSGVSAVASPNAIILIIPPGQERELPILPTANGYVLDQLILDTDVAAQVCYVTAFIG